MNFPAIMLETLEFLKRLIFSKFNETLQAQFRVQGCSEGSEQPSATPMETRYKETNLYISIPEMKFCQVHSYKTSR